MKRKIYGISLIAVVALAASWNFAQSKNEVNLSEVALANVEALAGNENSDIECESSTLTCSFVVSTPHGNWVESHPNMKHRPY